MSTDYGQRGKRGRRGAVVQAADDESLDATPISGTTTNKKKRPRSGSILSEMGRAGVRKNLKNLFSTVIQEAVSTARHFDDDSSSIGYGNGSSSSSSGGGRDDWPRVASRHAILKKQRRRGGRGDGDTQQQGDDGFDDFLSMSQVTTGQHHIDPYGDGTTTNLPRLPGPSAAGATLNDGDGDDEEGTPTTTAEEEEEVDKEEVDPFVIEPLIEEAGPSIMGTPCAPTECFACGWDVGSFSVQLANEEIVALDTFIAQQMGNRNRDSRCIIISRHYEAMRARVNASLGPRQRPLPPWNPASVREHMRSHIVDPVGITEELILGNAALIRKTMNSALLKQHSTTGERFLNSRHAAAMDKATERLIKLLSMSSKPEDMTFGPKHRKATGMLPNPFTRRSEAVGAMFSVNPAYSYLSHAGGQLSTMGTRGGGGDIMEDIDDDDSDDGDDGETGGGGNGNVVVLPLRGATLDID